MRAYTAIEKGMKAHDFTHDARQYDHRMWYSLIGLLLVIITWLLLWA